MDRIDIVKEWLDFAKKDFESARYLLDMRPVPLEIICYHCQQAAEKMLKGYLIYQDKEPPRTHNLEILCGMCMNAEVAFEDLVEPCGRLTLYSVQSRYPYQVQISDSDTKTAIVDADRVMNFVLQKIQLPGEGQSLEGPGGAMPGQSNDHRQE
jgi:HEPN domain-containing protein